MSKIVRDARAFARRVQMGQDRLWLIVEGRTIDRVFYDRVLASGTVLEFSVRLAEQLELEGVSSGGKSFALSLYDFYEREDLLLQEANSGPKAIVFALDRDLDHLEGSERVSGHVVYTNNADVEAEILVNGDLRRAAGSAFSLDAETLAGVIAPASQLADELAERWREWIILGAVACCCGVQGEFRHRNTSSINVGGFGALDSGKCEQVRLRIETKLSQEGRGHEMAAAEARVLSIFEAGQQGSLVKGRWIATYVLYLVKSQTLDVPIQANIPAETLTKTCIETLDFSKPWATSLVARLTASLAA